MQAESDRQVTLGVPGAANFSTAEWAGQKAVGQKWGATLGLDEGPISFHFEPFGNLKAVVSFDFKCSPDYRIDRPLVARFKCVVTPGTIGRRLVL